jgi:HD superfamily phosphodiesterase
VHAYVLNLRRSLNFSYLFQAGKRRAERRHKFMEEFVKEFYDEWNGSS